MRKEVNEIVHILCSEALDEYDLNDVLVGATFFITGILRNIEGFKTPFATTFAELQDAIEEIIEHGVTNAHDEQ